MPSSAAKGPVKWFCATSSHAKLLSWLSSEGMEPLRWFCPKFNLFKCFSLTIRRTKINRSVYYLRCPGEEMREGPKEEPG